METLLLHCGCCGWVPATMPTHPGLIFNRTLEPACPTEYKNTSFVPCRERREGKTTRSVDRSSSTIPTPVTQQRSTPNRPGLVGELLSSYPETEIRTLARERIRKRSRFQESGCCQLLPFLPSPSPHNFSQPLPRQGALGISSV